MTDTGGGGFWLARGPCGACGRPAAKRVPGPGTHDVACNLCRAVTPHAAQYRPAAGSPSTEAAAAPSVARPTAPPAERPVALPAAAPTTASHAPMPRRAGTLKWVVTLVLLVGLAAAGAFWALSASLDEEPPQWSRLEHAAVPEFGADAVTMRVETKAYDADNVSIPADRLTAVPPWYFANDTARAESADAITGWTPCDPLTCAYRVQLGHVLYFNPFGPDARGAYALETGTRTLSRFAFDEWRAVDDWEPRLDGFTVARAIARTPGQDGLWRVMVFSNASNEDSRILNVSLVQGGEVVTSRAVEMSSPFDTPWTMPEFSATVKKGPVEVRVADEAGTLLATKTITPSDCDELETQVYVAMLADGRVHLDQVLCI